MRIAEFETLKCSCGGEKFVVLSRLKHRPDGGTITEQVGYQCIGCQALVDPRVMVQMATRQRAIEDIERLKAIVDEPIPPTPAAANMAKLIKDKVI